MGYTPKPPKKFMGVSPICLRGVIPCVANVTGGSGGGGLGGGGLGGGGANTMPSNESCVTLAVLAPGTTKHFRERAGCYHRAFRRFPRLST